MQNNFLTFEYATKLLKQFGSPLYVYSKDILQRNVQQIQQEAQGLHVSYAIKANSNPQIIKVIKKNGEGIKFVDVVSPGEIFRALESGYNPEDILYTENFISNEEIDYAIEKGVVLNVGALSTLEQHGEKLRGKEIFIRINPDQGAGQNYMVITGGPDSKFGICAKDFDAVKEAADKFSIKIVGLHQHIGSNLKEADKNIFIQTTKYVFEVSKKFPEVKFINIGGGMGVKYTEDEVIMENQRVFEEIKAIRDSYNKDLQIWIEPGRFFVANSAVLLCKITGRKETSKRVFYGTDTGMNHLIRPALYGSHHNIINLSPCDSPKQSAFICGNICECADILGSNIEISGKIGDILCIENAGAYGYVMSSNYNERPRPAEVMIEQSGHRLIRRRETFEDMRLKL